MNKTVIYICMFLLTFSANSQDYKNQGEAENAQTEKFFKEKYTKQNFELFKGVITEINETTIKYDDMILEINLKDQDFKTLFLKGVFYPQLFTGNATADELFGNGNFRISSFEELEFVTSNPRSKRFRFWLFTKGIANPKVFFIELTNENATKDMDLKSFLINSKLTFAKSGWMIL